MIEDQTGFRLWAGISRQVVCGVLSSASLISSNNTIPTIITASNISIEMSRGLPDCQSRLNIHERKSLFVFDQPSVAVDPGTNIYIIGQFDIIISSSDWVGDDEVIRRVEVGLNITGIR